MEPSTLLKYGAAAGLLASVYALVYLKLIEPAQYYNLVLMALGALGVNSLNGGNKQ
ncbi:MAG: hypothetical protein IT190_09710 [Microbacteriaceae bacterium]|nr:hypothetical protein [Microbacteriaceae bacterium]